MCPPKYGDVVSRSINNQDKWVLDVSLRIFHEFDLAVHAGIPRVSYSFFELDSLSQTSFNNLRGQDLALVATKWGQSILSQYNIESKVVPLGISKDFVPGPVAAKPIFATLGKWEIRKGHDILPDIFLKAFPTEDVELWCFTDNLFLNEEETNKWKQLYRNRLGSRVVFFPRVDDIIKHLNKVHCGIFISRAEGWNLGCLELMALGKQVIATNYSGHTEYCNSNNSLLVDIDELELAYDGRWFFNNGNWAKIGEKQEKQIIEHLRTSYKDFHNGNLVNKCGIETGKQFTFERTANEINAIVEGI
jgi:glycosyltransferase involved in cell wall biosynthesis